jgi:hypothetical protein
MLEGRIASMTIVIEAVSLVKLFWNALECLARRSEPVRLSAEWCAAVLQNIQGCVDEAHYEYDPKTWQGAEPDKANAVIDQQ